jgi:hypothetical protein
VAVLFFLYPRLPPVRGQGMVRHSLANVPPANVSVDYAHELGISIVSKPTGETKTETISGAS